MQTKRSRSRRMRTWSRKKKQKELRAACFHAQSRFLNTSSTSTRSRSPVPFRGPSMQPISFHFSRDAFLGDKSTKERTSDSISFISSNLKVDKNTMPHLRASTSASYCPTIQPDKLDKSKTSIKSISPSERSELQAYWIVQQWLTKAMAVEKPAKRRRT